jgi:DNA-directed RNA polymerase specialized sigma24 family protein
MPRMPDLDGAMFEQLRPRLTAISRRIVGSQADPEDIVQDSFIKWQGADRDAVTMPAAWLTVVVHHASIDLLRRHQREQALAQVTLDPVMTAPEETLLQR